MKTDYAEEFHKARRVQVKLAAALAALPEMNSLPAPLQKELLDYIALRRRSAVLQLIADGDLARLKLLHARGWIEEREMKKYLSEAVRLSETQVWAWLYGLLADIQPNGTAVSADAAGSGAGRAEKALVPAGAADSRTGRAEDAGSADAEAGHPGEPESSVQVDEPDGTGREVLSRKEQDLCGRVWKLTVKNLRMKLPGLSGALAGYRFLPSGDCRFLEDDGFTLRYAPRKVMDAYLDSPQTLCRAFLHILMHNLNLHPAAAESRERRYWDLACDMTIERMLDDWNIRGLTRGGRDFRRYTLREMGLPMSWSGAESIYRTLKKQYPDFRKLERLTELYRIDDHVHWYAVPGEKEPEETGSDGKAGDGEGDSGVRDRQQFITKWGRLSKEWSFQTDNRHEKAGTSAGKKVTEVKILPKEEFDYRSFLQNFMVSGEEVETDLDSFDYLPYWYSRTHYDGIVFFEPLEYKEVHRLDEIIIAIDTSGSCSGMVVRRFLEETWRILTEKGNFFHKMHVHIVQCDCAIQEHVLIRSRDEFRDYMDRIKVKGFGGTDFRPVFELADDLIRRKQLLNLRALLYFTDGDGVYPTEKPSYDTAFIFLNNQYEKAKIPEWGIRLNLGLELGD